MTIPKITPYSGGVANPDGSQTQTEFTQNMFDQLSYEAQLASELNATVSATNATASEVSSNAAVAQNSADTAQAAANFEGDFTVGVTSAVKGKSYSYGGNVWLCLQNTTSTPSTSNAAWKLSVGEQYVTEAQEDLLPLGSSLFKGNDGIAVKNGDTVPAGPTHLRVLVGGKPTIVAMSPIASGTVSLLTDFNVTIGSIEVTLIRNTKKPITVDVSQFGIEPGVGIDNSEKFLRLREFIYQNRDSKIEVNFTKPGVYESRYSRWTWGAKHLTINAYGVRLYNNDPNGRSNTIESLPLVTNQDIFQNYPYGDFTNTPFSGSLISTVAAGSDTVSLINPTEISEFAAGDSVLIYGFDQQFSGFPPNARFYEYRKVESIDGVSTLTLDRPLINKYRDDWYEFITPELAPSKARVINITRENSYIIDYLEINGLETTPNPAFTISQANGGIIGKNVRTLILNDCSGPYFANGENETVTLNRCKFDYFEPDKICNTLITNDCSFGVITQGTGVNLIDINRGEIWDRGDLSPKILNLNNPLLTSENFSAMFSLSTNMPTQSATLDVTCVPKVTTESILSGASEVSITLSAQLSGNAWEIVTNTAARNAIRGITTGTVLKNSTVDVFAIVKEIYGNSNGIVIELISDGALTGGDILSASTVQELNVKRVSQLGPNKGIPLERRSSIGNTLNINRINDQTGDGEGPSKSLARTITYDPSLPQQYSEISGYIRKIEVWVKRAYTGPDVGKVLQVRSYTPAYTFASIDIYTVGNRTLTPTETAGSAGTDSLNATAMEYADKLLFNLAGGLTGSGTELPEIIITFDFVTN